MYERLRFSAASYTVPFRWMILFSNHAKLSHDLFSPESDQGRKAADAWLRGMPENARHLGPSAAVYGMRPRRVLRFIEEQARDEAFSRDETPHHQIH
jgi:hypothetical protein